MIDHRDGAFAMTQQVRSANQNAEGRRLLRA
jgi:hypothetical protein